MRCLKQVVLALLLVQCLVSLGQSNDKWRAGSAHILNGKVYVLTVFISEYEWSYKEKLEIYTKIYEAQNWLTAQAKKYSKNVSFVGGNFGLDKTVIYDHIPVGTGSGSEPTNLVGSVLQKVGYTSTSQFTNWVKQNTDCTNSLVLIIANKNGRGYAMPFSNEMNKEEYFLEGCILYNRFDAERELSSAAVAHEFLHLFGAWDLYETFMQPADREEKARQLFPDEIMLRTSYNINELKVDKLTAWLVGLSSFQENWYEWFRPNRY